MKHATKAALELQISCGVNERGLLWAGAIETKDIFNWEPVSKKTYKIKHGLNDTHRTSPLSLFLDGRAIPCGTPNHID